MKNRIISFDLARTIAIVSIMSNHAVNMVYDNYNDQIGEFISSSNFSMLFKAGVSVFSRLGVPIFLMLTGALVLNRTFTDNDSIKKYYKENVGGILITTEFWYLIMFLYLSWDSGQSLDGILLNALFVNQRSFGSMWYMPMILCVYIILPFFIVFLSGFSVKFIFLPLILVFVDGMLIPEINALLALFEINKTFTFSISLCDLFSVYWLYVFSGYLINKMKNMGKLRYIYFFIVFFSISVWFQYIAYSRDMKFLLKYQSPIILISSIFLFKVLIGIEIKNVAMCKIITFISKISFGLYFVHIIIMYSIDKYLDWPYNNRPMQFFFLMFFTSILSLLFISISCKSKWVRKICYRIKS